MKNFHSLSRSLFTLLAIASLHSSLAHADGNETLDEATLHEEVRFIEQAANLDPEIIATSATEPVYLGRITNRSTQQSIEIDCIEGTKEACKKLGFYLISGIKADQPFKTIEVKKLNLMVSDGQPDFRYFATAEWVFYAGENESSGTNILLWLPIPIAEVLIVVDTLIAPVRAIVHFGKVGPYKKARKALYQALTTGATVSVSNKQFNALQSMLNQ